MKHLLILPLLALAACASQPLPEPLPKSKWAATATDPVTVVATPKRLCWKPRERMAVTSNGLVCKEKKRPSAVTTEAAPIDPPLEPHPNHPVKPKPPSHPDIEPAKVSEWVEWRADRGETTTDQQKDEHVNKYGGWW